MLLLVSVLVLVLVLGLVLILVLVFIKLFIRKCGWPIIVYANDCELCENDIFLAHHARRIFYAAKNCFKGNSITLIKWPGLNSSAMKKLVLPKKEYINVLLERLRY